ncbi:gamma carbonic anhydrase family protein [Elusimicrobiota bacterium]
MIYKYKSHEPYIDPSSYIADTANIIGRVTIKKNASVWHNAVLRADVDEITVGEKSNVQDGVLIHVDFGMPVVIGSNVTIGHGAILHGCQICDFCLIGMGAILLDGSRVEGFTIVGAGAVVTEKQVLEKNAVYMGMPAKKVRDVTSEDIELIKKRGLEYIALYKDYL